MHAHFPLTTQDKANLAALLPPKLLKHSDSLSLLACYGNGSFPAPALHYLERQLWQREGAATSLAEAEALLITKQLWRPLRDLYTRASTYEALPEEQRSEALCKALLLATYRAPHPPLATQLLLQALEKTANWLTDEMIHQLMQRCLHLGWHVQLMRWLQALQTAGRTHHQHQDLRQKLEALYPTPKATPAHETDSLRTEASALQLQAVETKAPEDARHLWLRAARLLSSSLPTHAEGIDCWTRLLQDAPEDSVRWHKLYEATIPTQLWELLGQVLRRFPTRTIQLPTAPRLRLPLLLALEQQGVPGLDPLPLLLMAFQQNPLNHRRFQALSLRLQEAQQWRLLRRVLSLRLAYLCAPALRPSAEAGAAPDPNDGPSHHKLPNQTHADLAALLDALQRHTPGAANEIYSAFTIAMAFAPHEDALLSQLSQWSYEQPPEHPVHQLLQQLALEGRGDNAFQLEIAANLANLESTPNPRAAQQASQIYQQLLHTNPGNLDALQQARALALRQHRSEDALKWLEQELKYQKEQTRRIPLLLQKASLLSARLHRHTEAINACQEALRLNPQHRGTLRQMAALLEQQQQYQRLLPILGQLLPLLDSPDERRAALRKLTRFALNPAKDHTTVLRALHDLLQQPYTTPECLDALEQLLQLPKAQAPLLSFLLEQEQLIDVIAKPHISLLIIRLMFRLLRFQEARSRLKQFLHDAKASLPLLQRCEEVAIEHRAWHELAETLQAQIELLLLAPYASPSLGSLYLRLAHLYDYLLEAPARAEAAYRAAILYSPQNPDAHEPLLQQLLERGAYREGCALLQAHAERLPPPTAAAAFTRLALLQHLHLRQPQLALASVSHALELNPHHAPALEALVSLQQQ